MKCQVGLFTLVEVERYLSADDINASRVNLLSLQYRLASKKKTRMLIEIISRLRTFAILYTYPGENPFDLGRPLH